MKSFKIIGLTLLFFFVSGISGSSNSISSNPLNSSDGFKGPNYVKGEVIVKYKKDVPDERINGLHQRMNAIKKRDIPNLRIQSVKIPDFMSVEDAIAKYKPIPQATIWTISYQWQQQLRVIPLHPFPTMAQHLLMLERLG